MFADEYRSGDTISIHALLAESDQDPVLAAPVSLLFLSTLSLRRATARAWAACASEAISIHALLAESDANAHSVIGN